MNFAKECAEIEKVLNIKYAAYITGKQFVVQTEINGTTLQVTFLLKNETQSFYYPVNTRIELLSQEPDKDRLEKFYVLADYMDYYFDEYFKSEEFISLPIDWTDYSFEDFQFQMKGQIIDLEKEQLADKFLS